MEFISGEQVPAIIYQMLHFPQLIISYTVDRNGRCGQCDLIHGAIDSEWV